VPLLQKMLVSAACAVLLKATESKSAALAPALWAVRRTVFPHFAAGVDIDECAATAARMSEKARAQSIIDWSSEEAESPEELEHNLLSKLKLLESVRGKMPHTASFVAVKLTALVEPSLLETVTAAMHRASASSDATPGVTTPSQVISLEQLESLSANDCAAVSSTVARLQTLAEAARAAELRLLLDAEQTHRQPAINLIARELQKRTNARVAEPTSSSAKDNQGAQSSLPVVYNTFQMYLDDAPLYGGTSLAAELAYAKAHGFTMAAKVVRGANCRIIVLIVHLLFRMFSSFDWWVSRFVQGLTSLEKRTVDSVSESDRPKLRPMRLTTPRCAAS
jgi:hypothetical protein